MKSGKTIIVKQDSTKWKITLAEKSEIQNLNISEFKEHDPTSDSISDTVLKAIVKYRDYASIIAIKETSCLNSLFNFWQVEEKDVLKEVKKLKPIKHKILIFQLNCFKEI